MDEYQRRQSPRPYRSPVEPSSVSGHKESRYRQVGTAAASELRSVVSTSQEQLNQSRYRFSGGSPRRKRLILITSGIISLLAAIGVLTYLLRPQPMPHFPPGLVSTVGFPLYYPAKLPAGYSVDEKSLPDQTDPGLVYIVLEDGSTDQTINITEQATPSQHSDLVALEFQKNLSTPVSMPTPYGQAIGGTISGRVAGSLMTGKTWILVSAASGVNTDTLAAVFNGLQLDH